MSSTLASLYSKGKGYCYADPLVIVPARTCAKKLTSKAQIMETHSCELHPLHSIFAFFAQPAQGASQPASTHPSRATCFPWWRLFFSFLMTYYMYASLLLVVSIDAGRDYRAPVQNRCSKGPLRPRSCLVAVSALRPHASLSPPLPSPPVPRHADCERGVVAEMQYRCSEWASNTRLERARLFMLRGSVAAKEGQGNGVGCTAQ